MPPLAACLRAAARTVVGRPGGALREVPALELALVAARRLTPAAAPDLVVAAQALSPPVDLGRRLADALHVPRHAQTAGANAGAAALALGIAAVAGGTARSALVVGTESASTVPYWVPGLRWGAHTGGAEAVDPAAALFASLADAEVPGERSRLDAWAARSHAAAAASAPGTPVGDVAADELPGGGEERLAALKPLLHHEGTLTAGSVALPADGAAAVLLAADGGPPLALGAPDGAVAAAELDEGSAQVAAGLAEALGLDVAIVNAGGGAIGFGDPVAATPLMMLARLGARLGAGEAGVLCTGGVTLTLRA